MRFPYHEIPLLKPLILFILGIVAAEYFKTSFRLSSLLFYIVLGLFFYTIFRKKINKVFHSSLIICICFSLGYINHQERSCLKPTLESNQIHTLSLRIEKIISHKKHKKCFARILSCLDNKNNLVKTEGKILIYFKDMSIDSSIAIGNEYLVSGKPFALQKSNNPYCFDYGRYLNHQGIYQQLFVDSQQVKLIRKNQNTCVDRFIQSVRIRCINVFKKYFSDEDKLGVLQAMVLGKRDGLQEDINQAFIDTGAIHVLAVSGLHVGIVCMFISFIFKVLEPIFRISKFKRGIISLIFIWLFAMITGGSPAVCRAALMFSLFYVAKDILHRPVSVYNVLCGAALILITINPSQIFQVGFQFSFLAVFSIVFFYPYVSSILVTRYKWINYFYSSVALGIAAQILVFPLSIFYFNKFANSFLISSLFVVQFAMVILVSGLILLIFEFIGLVIINKLLLVPSLDFILDKFQWMIESVQALPLSATDNLWIDQIQLFLIYILILCLMYFLKRSRHFAYLGLVFCFVFINYSVNGRIDKNYQHVFYLYDAKEICADLMIGDKVFHLGNIPEKEGNYIYGRNRLSHAIESIFPLNEGLKMKSFEYNKGIFRLGEFILLLAKKENLTMIKNNFDIDYILVSKDHNDLQNIPLDKLRKTEIILDGSLKYWEREKALTFIQENQLNVYDIKVKGAKKIKF